MSRITKQNAKNEQHLAFQMRLRLRFAYYKLVTNQKLLKLDQLSPPDSWSIKAFNDATALSKKQCFRIPSFQPQPDKEIEEGSGASRASRSATITTTTATTTQENSTANNLLNLSSR